MNGIQNRNTELANIISQAVTAAVTETVKQLIPLMKYESTGCEDDEIAVKRQKRRVAGTIEKLPGTLRNRVDEMLLGTASYREIQVYLKLNGVNISPTSVHRYAQHLYNDEF